MLYTILFEVVVIHGIRYVKARNRIEFSSENGVYESPSGCVHTIHTIVN